MKKLTLLLAFMGLGLASIQAQRIASVDVASLLENMQEYKDAQAELDRIAAEWKQQIDQKRDEIRGLYNKYQSELVLLSDEAKRQREDEIMQKEKEMRDYQKQKFGPNGDLFQRRQELVGPIQDKVYLAIETYAEKRGYDFILDKGSSSGLIFANPRYDKTSDVAELLKD